MVPASKLQQKRLPYRACKQRGRQGGPLDKQDGTRGQRPGLAVRPEKTAGGRCVAVKCGTEQAWVEEGRRAGMWAGL